jgi:hypothetical protein
VVVGGDDREGVPPRLETTYEVQKSLSQDASGKTLTEEELSLPAIKADEEGSVVEQRGGVEREGVLAEARAYLPTSGDRQI